MKFAALIRDTLLEIRASSLMMFYGVFAIGILVVEMFFLGQSSSMHMNINGNEVNASGGSAIAQMFLPAAALFLAKVLGLFTLFGMSDVMTPVLTRGTAEVYLSKPVPRWFLLVARITGHAVAMFIALVVTLIAIFLVAGARVGVWDARIFASIAPAMLNIVVYLSVLTLSNILTGSSGVSGLLGFGVLMLASALRFHDVLANLFTNVLWRNTVQALYVICPKPQEIEDGITTLMTGHGGFPWFAVGGVRGGVRAGGDRDIPEAGLLGERSLEGGRLRASRRGDMHVPQVAVNHDSGHAASVSLVEPIL